MNGISYQNEFAQIKDETMAALVAATLPRLISVEKCEAFENGLGGYTVVGRTNKRLSAAEMNRISIMITAICATYTAMKVDLKIVGELQSLKATEKKVTDENLVGNAKPGGTPLTIKEIIAQMEEHNENVVKNGVHIYRRHSGYNPVKNYNDETIVFGSYEEADIWMNEIHGQLSDGKWESDWNSRTYMPYLWKVTVDTTKETTFPAQQWGAVRLSFTDLAELWDGDTWAARGRYDMKTAKKLLQKISKAYRQSYPNR